jgi:hypothetical protein
MVRLLKLALGAVALMLYTWFAAVVNLPRVRRHKAARRAR